MILITNGTIPLKINSNYRIQVDLDQKTSEIVGLNGQLEELRAKTSAMQSELETAQRESNDAKKERIQAVKAKALAEQQMVSIEYEYEQYKLRASRREKELVEQLNGLNENNEIKPLQDKLKAITEKAQQLETQLWQSEKNYQSEIGQLKATVYNEKLSARNAFDQLEKMKALQNEYDEVSMQLVDSIQENDQLKIKCSTLEENMAKLNEQIDGLKSQLTNESKKASEVSGLEVELKQRFEAQSLKYETQATEFEQKMEDRDSEMEKYRSQVDLLTKQLNERSKLIEESEECMEALRNEILEIKSQHDQVLEDYVQIVHRNTLLENSGSQCRMTIDCLSREMDVLRQGYTALKMSQAEQELEHLKMHKTICQYDETINGSVFNDTVSVINSTNQLNSNSTMNFTHCDKKDTGAAAELQKANEERDKYATQLDSIKSQLMRVTGVESSTFQGDITDILNKLLSICGEFNGIKSFLRANDINQNNDDQNIIGVIESLWNRNEDNENEKDSMQNELK